MMKNLYGTDQWSLSPVKKFLLIFTITVFGIAADIMGAFAAKGILFPLYLDSILTIGVTALCGLIPSVVCAVAVGIFNSISSPVIMFFSICHILTALGAWAIFTYGAKEGLKTKKLYTINLFLWAGILSALTNAVSGNIISGLIFGFQPPLPQANIVVQGIYAAFYNLGFADQIAGALENLIDKLLSSVLSFAAYYGCIKIIHMHQS